MLQSVGESNILYKLVSFIGLFGLVASFHGIILAAGRATFEFGRVKFAPPILGKVHKRFKTPANALILNMIIGIVALLTGKTGEIITIACFGALNLYIISMISMIVLRKREPEMKRPFKVPFYPITPIVALIIAIIAFISITIYNPWLAVLYFSIIGIMYIWFRVMHDNLKSRA
jgi:ethanolamine permease